jgi:hypothetical protein
MQGTVSKVSSLRTYHNCLSHPTIVKLCPLSGRLSFISTLSESIVLFNQNRLAKTDLNTHNTARSHFNMHLSFLFTAAFASIAIAQNSSAVTQSHQGPFTVTPYSAHSPGYTPPFVNTATMPAFSGAPSNTSSWSSTKNYNSTHTTKSSYTVVSSTLTTPASGSSGTASTSTGPVIPISTKNTGAVSRVAGTSLALLAAGSLVSLLM